MISKIYLMAYLCLFNASHMLYVFKCLLMLNLHRVKNSCDEGSCIREADHDCKVYYLRFNKLIITVMMAV